MTIWKIVCLVNGFHLNYEKNAYNLMKKTLKIGEVISPRKVSKWLTNLKQDSHYHELSGKCRLKPQLDI